MVARRRRTWLFFVVSLALIWTVPTALPAWASQPYQGADADQDGMQDSLDGCPAVFNPDHANLDAGSDPAAGLEDACDPEVDLSPASGGGDAVVRVFLRDQFGDVVFLSTCFDLVATIRQVPPHDPVPNDQGGCSSGGYFDGSIGGTSVASTDGTFTITDAPGDPGECTGLDQTLSFDTAVDTPAAPPGPGSPGLGYYTYEMVFDCADTDGDGLSSAGEARWSTDAEAPDFDDDGVDDGAEVHLVHSDPLLADTDLGGLSDGVEIARGSDPLESDDDATTFYPVSVEVSGRGSVSSAPAGIDDCDALCSHGFAEGAGVTLTATPDPGWEFIGWDGACGPFGADPCTLTVDGAKNALASFERSTTPVRLDVEVFGAGAVTSTPSGIACPPDCSEQFAPGTQVELQADPDEGETLLSWSGCDETDGIDCTLEMNVDASVRAVFSSPTCLTYPDFSSAPALALFGDAQVVDDVLRLTPNTVNQSGVAWHGAKVDVAGGFVTSFDFRLTEQGGNGDLDGPGADGITFAVQNSAVSATGSSAGGIGYDGLVDSLVVEFDTFNNGVLFGDPNGNHVAVHTGGEGANGPSDETLLDSAALDPEVLDLQDGRVHRARVSYDPSPGELRVFVDELSTPALTVPVDLDATLALDDGTAWVGFTSATGGGYERHDVLDWFHCSSTDAPPTLALAPTSATNKLGTNHTVTATLTDRGSPVVGADVEFSVLEGPNAGATATDATDANGHAGFTYSGSVVGTDEIRATVDLVGQVFASNTVTNEWANLRTLQVTRAGTGTGSVSSDPAGITCGADCSHDFADGASVTLTATPAAGSTFTGWTGACTGTGTCQVTMTADRAVTATFAASATRILTVTKSGVGSGSVTSSPAGIDCGVTCSANFTNGAAVTLTATPAAGSTFTGWSGACTGTGSCSVTMSANRSVTARFVPLRTLTVTKAGGGTGTVTSSPAGIDCGATCSAAFVNGAVVTLTATPGAGSTFTGWSGACTGTGSCSVTMSADRSVTATFGAVQRTLTVTKTGLGTGSVTSSPGGISCGITCSATYADGAVVALTASPAAGSSFIGWSGACTGTGTCTLTMTANRAVTATFARADGCTIVGTAHTDQLSGTSGADVICGLGGADTIHGMGGNDTILGGTGNDILFGEAGDDTIEGGDGADRAQGMEGNDGLTGGSGTDVLSYESANVGGVGAVVSLSVATQQNTRTAGLDTVGGFENITGSDGADVLTGDAGVNRIVANDGDDRVVGLAGDDTLLGSDHSDDLRGGGGNDTFNGGKRPAGDDDDVCRQQGGGVGSGGLGTMVECETMHVGF